MANKETEAKALTQDRKAQWPISLSARICYSFGHVQNDLFAGMWFSYLLVFYHQVNTLNNIYAGTLLLIGQIADAVATPFVGYESDQTSGFCRMGNRKSWHLLGTLFTLFSFPFIFSHCIGCSDGTADYVELIYYMPFIIIFQFGWAAVQITHFAIIPKLTGQRKGTFNTALLGYRNGFTALANIMVYGIAWALLSTDGSSVDKTELSAADSDSFRNLALIVAGIGLVFSFLFHVGVKETDTDPANLAVLAAERNVSMAENSIERSAVEVKTKGVKQWITDTRFYKVGLIYMAARLYANISQVYLPMYVTETLLLDKTSIANVPLVSFVGSFLMSYIVSHTEEYFGLGITFGFSVFMALGTSSFVYFIPDIPTNHQILVYIAAFLIGVAGSTMLVVTQAYTNALIGPYETSAAFVFGCMSLMDKLSNGIAVELVQLFHPCLGCCPACVEYYRKVQAFVPGSAAVLALIGVGLLYTTVFDKVDDEEQKQLLINPASVPDVNNVTLISPSSLSLVHNHTHVVTAEINGSAPVLINSDASFSSEESSDDEESHLLRNGLVGSRKHTGTTNYGSYRD